MDINLELIKRIISSDDLCEKANSLEFRDTYKEQIKKYVIYLIEDNVISNINYINRYLRKFVINQSISKEDIFFDEVLMKLYRLNIKDDEFISILNSFDFYSIKEILIKKYNQIIEGNVSVSINDIKRMFNFFYYVCPNFVLPNSYIDYFTFNLIKFDIELDKELMIYFYRSFALSFSITKGLNIPICISCDVSFKDPYYDIKRIVIYTHNIKNKVDYVILADIFYQIKYVYLACSINNSNYYTFEQLRFVKELCLITILGFDYFEQNYSDISFTSELKKQSHDTVKNYFNKLGLNMSLNFDIYEVVLDTVYDNFEDTNVSIDVLFDKILKRENPNLLKGLIKNYPILGSEYKNFKKKTLLNLLLDIYSNRKLLLNLNKDLNWYNSKVGKDEDIIVLPKIDRLKNKISLCTSYINVMNLVISSGDMTSSDLLRSISDLITYDTNDEQVKNDIYSILNVVIPRKIERLCFGRDSTYKEEFKSRVIKCYLDSMNLVKKNIDNVYFMKIYSSLEICISAFK